MQESLFIGLGRGGLSIHWTIAQPPPPPPRRAHTHTYTHKRIRSKIYASVVSTPVYSFYKCIIITKFPHHMGQWRCSRCPQPSVWWSHLSHSYQWVSQCLCCTRLNSEPSHCQTHSRMESVRGIKKLSIITSMHLNKISWSLLYNLYQILALSTCTMKLSNHLKEIVLVHVDIYFLNE